MTFTDTATGDIYEVTTDGGGNFSIEVPSGNHDVKASHPGYLSARKFDVVIGAQQPNTIPPVTLAGGDVDGDGDTDSRDLLVFGRQFDTSGSPSDLNGDGVADILDLAMAASNIGRSDSPWPESLQAAGWSWWEGTGELVHPEGTPWPRSWVIWSQRVYSTGFPPGAWPLWTFMVS